MSNSEVQSQQNPLLSVPSSSSQIVSDLEMQSAQVAMKNKMEARAMKFVHSHILFKEKYFEFLEYKEENVVIAECCTCKQKKQGTGNSPSNLITHLKRCHPEVYNQFENLKKSVASGGEKHKKSLKKVDRLNSINNKEASITKEDVEKAIIRFIIQDMQPFMRTETAAFQNLIAVCLGYSDFHKLPFNLMSEKTVKRKISDLYEEHEKMLASLFSEQKWFCLTADIWSCKNRSFFGVSAHFLDEKTLKRKSFVISCEDFPSPHTHEHIAERLQILYHKFSIKPSSVVASVTDNGSNFVCSFKVFGRSKEEFSNVLKLIRDACDENDSKNVPDDLDSSKIMEVLKKLLNDTSQPSESDLQDEAAELYDIISSNDEENDNAVDNHVNIDIQHIINNEELCEDDMLALSNRFPCNTHNLNLVGGVDSLAAHSNKTYSRMYETVFEKLNLLWDASSRQKTSEILIKCLGTNINKPNKTRWNWCYDRISEILRFDSMKLNLAMLSLQISPFTEGQRQFLNEYKVVLKPIARALDNLQQSEIPYATVLPTIYDTNQKLNRIKNQNLLNHCKPLLLAVLRGFNKRLGYILDIKDQKSHAAIIATVVHPYFKLRWIKNEERNSKYIEDITNILVDGADQIFIEDWRNINVNNDSRSASVENIKTRREMTEQTGKLKT